MSSLIEEEGNRTFGYLKQTSLPAMFNTNSSNENHSHGILKIKDEREGPALIKWVELQTSFNIKKNASVVKVSGTFSTN